MRPPPTPAELGAAASVAWALLLGTSACSGPSPTAPQPLGATDAPAVEAPERVVIGWGRLDPPATVVWASPFASAAEAIVAFQSSGRPFGWSDGAGGLLLSDLPLDVELGDGESGSETSPILRLRTTPALWIGPPTASPPEDALALWVAEGAQPAEAEGWSALPGSPPTRNFRVGPGWSLVQARAAADGQWMELSRAQP
jgi:hypothetical protein